MKLIWILLGLFVFIYIVGTPKNFIKDIFSNPKKQVSQRVIPKEALKVAEESRARRKSEESQSKRIEQTKRDEYNNFRQVGYFKDGVRNRIFTIEMKGSFTKSKALAFARSKPNTSGQITAVYFYPVGSTIPSDGVTLAKNIFQANSVLYDTKGLSKWRFAYMKYLNGSESFVDCNEKADNYLCRQ